MAVERPSYRVELEAKPFEVRLYPGSIVAVVQATGSRSEAVNAGFRLLAGYIFGANQASDKIAMTAPVQQSGDPGRWEVRFTMPSAYALETLPRPRDDRIRLIPVPARRMAVITFSGFWSDANLKSHQAALAGFIQAQRLTPVGPPVFAYYDPPWIPWFWRTNEVQIEVSPAAP